jgi:hypothetical protein
MRRLRPIAVTLASIAGFWSVIWAGYGLAGFFTGLIRHRSPLWPAFLIFFVCGLFALVLFHATMQTIQKLTRKQRTGVAWALSCALFGYLIVVLVHTPLINFALPNSFTYLCPLTPWVDGIDVWDIYWLVFAPLNAVCYAVVSLAVASLISAISAMPKLRSSPPENLL